MKVKIKSFNGELPSYLTADKVYEIEGIDHEGIYFICTGQLEYTWVTLNNCPHLNGGSWEIVE